MHSQYFTEVNQSPYEPTNEGVYNSATEWNTIPNNLKKNPTWANTDSNWLALQSKCFQDDPTKYE